MNEGPSNDSSISPLFPWVLCIVPAPLVLDPQLNLASSIRCYHVLHNQDIKNSEKFFWRLASWEACILQNVSQNSFEFISSAVSLSCVEATPITHPHSLLSGHRRREGEGLCSHLWKTTLTFLTKLKLGLASQRRCPPVYPPDNGKRL